MIEKVLIEGHSHYQDVLDYALLNDSILTNWFA